MGCGASAHEARDGAAPRYRTKHAVYSDGDPDRVVGFDTASHTDDSVPRTIDPGVQDNYDEVDAMAYDMGQSVGHLTPEPSEFSRSISEASVVLRGRLAHKINDDPEQFLASADREAQRELAYAFTPEVEDGIARWLVAVERSSCDGFPLAPAVSDHVHGETSDGTSLLSRVSFVTVTSVGGGHNASSSEDPAPTPRGHISGVHYTLSNE